MSLKLSYQLIPCRPIGLDTYRVSPLCLITAMESFTAMEISNTASLMRNVRVCCRVTDCSWPEDRIIMSETRESVHGPRSAPSTLRAAMSMSISTNGATYCTQQDGSGSRVQVQHCKLPSEIETEAETAGECGVILADALSLPVYHIHAVRAM
jgi:hypothetical protein